MSFFQRMLRTTEFLRAVPKSDQFIEGALTPEEFVTAGDFLVRKCGTWQWEAGDPAKARSYLPADKQYLVTRQVPCRHRIKDLATGNSIAIEQYLSLDGSHADAGDADAWVLPDPDKSKPVASVAAPVAPSTQDDDEEEEIERLDDLSLADSDDSDDESDDEDPALAAAEDKEAAQARARLRTYDLSLTYDLHYRTPRVWLFGYDNQGNPLSYAQIREDISAEHADKTVTYEPHPHLADTHQASVHPCQHAAVMKRLIAEYHASGKPLTVDQYLVLFLKFIAAVIPTTEYDFTVQI